VYRAEDGCHISAILAAMFYAYFDCPLVASRPN